MKRQVSYQWRLREVMAAHGMFTISDLVGPLVERGITLSVSQVHRLASGTPERLSLSVLAALCDIFSCTPAELIATKAENVAIARPPLTREWSISTRAGPRVPAFGPKDEPNPGGQGGFDLREVWPGDAYRVGSLARGHPLRNLPHPRAGNLRAMRWLRG
jgi:DNA-binding Xre family transcriptional regulator